jgi:TldD protein
MRRRDFLRTTAAAGAALAASDLVADLVAQSSGKRVLESRFKGLSDVALREAKRLGCSYTDIRFTRNVDDSVSVRDRIVTEGFGFGGRGRSESAGFGVRVIHGGVWGFSSGPIVTEDEIRKTTRIAVDVAKASAIAKRVDVKLVPVPAYTDYWAVPIKRDPFQVPLDEKIAFLMKVNEAVLKNKEVFRVQSAMAFDYEWKYLATSEGSYLEQEVWRTSPGFNVIARKGRSVRVAPSTSRREPAATRSSRTRRCSKTPSESPRRRSNMRERRRCRQVSRTWCSHRPMPCSRSTK